MCVHGVRWSFDDFLLTAALYRRSNKVNNTPFSLQSYQLYAKLKIFKGKAFLCTEEFFFHLQIFAYIKEKNDFLDLLLLHIGTSAIVDYLIKLLRDAEPDEMKNKFVEVRILMTNCRKITIRNNLVF